MSRIHWVDRGTGIPKDRDEVNRREVSECDGRVCDLDMMVVPSKLSVIRKTTVLARARSTLFLIWGEKAARKWNGHECPSDERLKVRVYTSRNF